MAASGGVALLAVAAGLMSPPPPPAPRAVPAHTLNSTPAPAAPPPAPHLVPAVQAMPPVTHAPMAPGAAPPPPANDPTTTLAQAVPQRVPLARDQRDPTAMARLDAAAAAPPSATPPAPPSEPARARVGETELGLRLLPGSRPVPESARRVPDGAGGEALALSLAGSGTLDAAVQFYRQQLVADGLPADAVQVLRPGNGQALLRAPSPQGGEQTVWIVENGSTLDIVLARVRPGPTAQR